MSINAEMLAEKAKDIRIDIIREIHAASPGTRAVPCLLRISSPICILRK